MIFQLPNEQKWKRMTMIEFERLQRKMWGLLDIGESVKWHKLAGEQFDNVYTYKYADTAIPPLRIYPRKYWAGAKDSQASLVYNEE